MVADQRKEEEYKYIYWNSTIVFVINEIQNIESILYKLQWQDILDQKLE